MTVIEAAKNILARDAVRWRHIGYGMSACSSCGTRRDDESGRSELCSRSCVWRVLEEAIAAADVQP